MTKDYVYTFIFNLFLRTIILLNILYSYKYSNKIYVGEKLKIIKFMSSKSLCRNIQGIFFIIKVATVQNSDNPSHTNKFSMEALVAIHLLSQKYRVSYTRFYLK